ncbi:MAG TPA: hypothetical protein VIJ62_09330 [Rhizomicrobium sp.]
MSELINTKYRNENFRRNLLANVSLVAMLGYFGVSQAVLAESADGDKPVVWVELGAQFQQADQESELFAPPFVENAPAADRDPMIAPQEPLPFSIGGEGKIAFEPSDTGWVLSAAIVYGRSSGAKHDHKQTQLPYVKQYVGLVGRTRFLIQPRYDVFGDGQTTLKESHDVIDFKAGKDVGLGLFGADGKSVFSAGVRFAQFTSSSNVALHARPEYKLGALNAGNYYYITSSGKRLHFRYRTYNILRRTNEASAQIRRSTHALGPSISWDASARVAGNDPGMTVAVDWGLNAAVLFGRQRVHIHQQTTGSYHAYVGGRYASNRHLIQSSYANAPGDVARSRGATIPNVGGFAGITFEKSITKISLGYKADFFFNVMDGGIDTAKKENVGFYGPFATISIGIGG